GFAEGFVIEADVAACDGSAERSASFGDAINGLGKLPHDFGLFRVAEIQTVGRGNGTSAAGGDVAGSFGDGVHGTEFWIELAPAAVAVGGESQRFHHAILFGFLDSNHGRVARAWAGKGIGAHRGVVLFGYPALRSDCG